MPFTPFHLGPGAAFKAVTGRYFSFMVFAFSQVAIDLEPLIRFLRDDDVLHGVTHTYLGATVIGIVSIVLGKPICEYSARWWNAHLSPGQTHWFRVSPEIPWPAAIVGALAGVYSHVALDSIMHIDMRPWSPFGNGNALIDLVSIDQLHLLCIGLGVFGITMLGALLVWRKLSPARRTQETDVSG
ncbi:MAG: DUF4184 family protein [Acidiferrobacterales bacterium]|nr:DUF4184 family protein [Acidiferrobacterales bacterium]